LVLLGGGNSRTTTKQQFVTAAAAAVKQGDDECVYALKLSAKVCFWQFLHELRKVWGFV
jgi:hypothetical protein